MTKYNKLWAALIGLIVLVAFRHFDIELEGIDAIVTEIVITAATAFGVYRVPNNYDA